MGVRLTTILMAAWALAAGGELGQVRSVYLLPMNNGFDQYLASQLAMQGVFQVVTDPRKADAVLTDQIGPAFEQRFDELYPQAPAPAGEAKAEGEKAAEPQAERAESWRISSFRRGKGNLFLVHRESRQILWSIHQRPKNASPPELNRTAAKVAARLKETLGLK
jgi:hypothetical protein